MKNIRWFLTLLFCLQLVGCAQNIPAGEMALYSVAPVRQGVLIQNISLGQFSSDDQGDFRATAQGVQQALAITLDGANLLASGDKAGEFQLDAHVVQSNFNGELGQAISVIQYRLTDTTEHKVVYEKTIQSQANIDTFVESAALRTNFQLLINDLDELSIELAE